MGYRGLFFGIIFLFGRVFKCHCDYNATCVFRLNDVCTNDLNFKNITTCYTNKLNQEIRCGICCQRNDNRSLATRGCNQYPALFATDFDQIHNITRKVYMINSCLGDYHDDDVIQKCLTKHNASIIDSVPVTHKVLLDTYSNKHCALCNGYTTGDTIIWDSRLLCRTETDVSSTLFNNVNDIQDCDVLFLPPKDLETTACRFSKEMASNGISVNESVIMILNDVYGDNKTHCACPENNNNISNLCEFGSSQTINTTLFTGLIDLAVLDYTDTNDTFCEPLPISDKYDISCRDVTCPPGMRYINGICKSVLLQEGQRFYELYLLVDTSSPNQCLSSENVAAFISSFEISFIATVRNISLYKYVYKYRFIYDPAIHNCDTNSTVFPDSFVMHVYMYSDGIGKTEVIDRALVLDGYILPVYIQTISTGLMKFLLKIDGRDYKSHGYHGLYYTHPETGSKLEVIKEVTVGNAPETQVRITRIVKTLVCPRILLRHQNLNITENKTSICVDEIQTCFQQGTFVKDIKGVFVCIDLIDNRSISNTSTLTVSLTSICDETIFNDKNFHIMTITVIFVSMIFVTLTLVTYLLFPVMRIIPGRITVCVCVIMFLLDVLLLLITQTNLTYFCYVIGGMLHYLWIMILLVMGVCLDFLNFNLRFEMTKNRPYYARNKYLVVCFIFPLIFVGINIAYSTITSSGADYGYGRCMCFISDPVMVGFTFTCPVFLIIIGNYSLFVGIMDKIRDIWEGDVPLSLYIYRDYCIAYTKLSGLAGVMWVFGLIYGITHEPWTLYIFSILHASLGVCLFVSFIWSRNVNFKYNRMFNERQIELTEETVKIDK